MEPGGLRALAVGLLAVALGLSVVSARTGERWANAVAFLFFAAAVAVFLRWRSTLRARVLAREEKTTE